jgi:hypothetical protein
MTTYGTAFAVVDDIVPNGKAPQAVVNLVAPCARLRRSGEEREGFRDRIDDAVCNVDAAGVLAM